MSPRTSALIIAYHALEEGPGPLCLPPSVFKRQVEILCQSGCVLLPVEELVERVKSGVDLPDRTASLTFDDGYASTHAVALPLLADLGARATVYPVTGSLGGRNSWDDGRLGIPSLPLMTPSQLRELAAAGWEIGGHTHTHAPLPSLGADGAARDIRTSSAILEDLFGRPVRTFAYPYGRHDYATREVASKNHDACLGIGASKACLSGSLDRLGRVDAWYLQREWQLRRIHGGLGDVYLTARRLARGVHHKLSGFSRERTSR